MDYIKDREIRKLKKILDEKERISLDKSKFNPETTVVGYQYRPPLEVLVPEERRTFSKFKEDMLIENMINSCIFIYGNVKLEVSNEDWIKFKQEILDYLMSLNHPLEYSKCVLKIVDDLFAHSKKSVIRINDLIENVIILSEDGYSVEDLLNIKQSLYRKIENKVIELNNYKKR